MTEVQVRATYDEVIDRILVKTTGGDFETNRLTCKGLPGARWDRTRRAWSYPATASLCRDLRAAWGDRLTVLPALRQWYQEKGASEAAVADLSAAQDATLTRLPLVAPDLAASLRADQRAGVAWCAAGYRGGGVLAPEPGLGKTRVAIGGILESGITGPILITCQRLAIRNVWKREFAMWTDIPVFMARGPRKKRQQIIEEFFACEEETKVLVTLAETLRAVEEPREDNPKKKKVVGYEYPDLFDHEWAWQIADESHKAFGSLTITKGNKVGKGLKHLPLAPGGQRRAVTGTPFGKGGRVQGMFGTLHWMWPDEFTSFWKWAGLYFNIDEDEVYIKGGRGQKRKTMKVGGLKKGISEEKFFQSLGPRIFRRTEAEVYPDRKPMEYFVVECEMTPKQAKQYKQLSDDAEIKTSGGILTADGPLALFTRARQIADGEISVREDGSVWFTGESGKIDALFEKLDTRGIMDGSGTMKVMVVSQYVEFLKPLGNRLEDEGVPYHFLHGGRTDKQRDDIRDDWQENPDGPRVLLLQSAAGISVDLDAADEGHLLDEMFNPEENEQIERRLRRSGKDHHVRIYYYRSLGTADTALAEDVEGKRRQQHNVLDGRRGLEYARRMVKYRPEEEG